MCGIAGVLNFDGAPVQRSTLVAMAERLIHRGPEGDGYFVDGALGFGHRRLKILDLTDAAEQPISSSDGRFTLIYNGEVYNFRDLRETLISRGYAFRSNGDTEVVLNSLVEWGEDAIPMLNGMFALALWDAKERTLLLARDRYGIKPLYHVTIGGTLIFASEIKALLAHPKLDSELDSEGLLEYLTFQNFFSDRTLFKNVRMLPAGHTLRLTAGDEESCALQNYWDFNFTASTDAVSDEEYMEELDRLFVQAVNRQLVADVPVGSYLSGGMDTGSIVAVAAKAVPGIRTFTIGFDLHSASGLEVSFDEREQAEFLSGVYGTEQYERVLKAGDMERCLPAVARHIEEPRVGQSYPMYYAAKLASSFGKVVLSGAGGDELFGGYPWRYFLPNSTGSFDEFIDAYYLYWQRLIPNTTIRHVFDPIWGDVKHVWTRDIFSGVFRDQHRSPKGTDDFVNLSLYFEAKTFLHGLLAIEDKLSMAHSLETRLPFLDNDLVDFAMKVPVRLKVSGEVAESMDENTPLAKQSIYYSRTRNGKLILRDSMKRYLPDHVVRGAKQGFSGPDASWFRGDSIEYVRRTLLDEGSPIYQVLNREAVGELVMDHISGRQNRRLFVWSMLYLDQWFRTYLP